MREAGDRLVEMADRNSTYSVLRERIVEHAFVAEVRGSLWRQET